ncbi:unnamed protein product [Caenorhabditis angaria]|uniref:Uncharacterized protein n=1 Tax=Caenorhabditis angaria TaxID=860376 RepID=A0A9P1IEU2_9PELO|nr:unnamed protein product [Caenorhabditis angaria]
MSNISNNSAKLSTIELSIDLSYQLENKFIDFINQRTEVVPVEQFDQNWIWQQFASIYNTNETHDIIRCAFRVFVLRSWRKTIKMNIKFELLKHHRVKIDEVMEQYMCTFHGVHLTISDTRQLIDWNKEDSTFNHSTMVIPENVFSSTLINQSTSKTNSGKKFFQPEKCVDEFGETQTQAPPNSLEDTEDTIMLQIIKKAAKSMKKSDEK